jgi:hypothetical protein
MVDFAKLRANKKPLIAKDEIAWECCPMGEHTAVCIDVIDLGEVEKWSTKKNKSWSQHSVVIVWAVYPEGNQGQILRQENGQCFKMDQEYKLSLARDNKFCLGDHLDSWAGQALSDKTRENFDVMSLIGKPCTLTVQTQPRKDGTLYATVLAIDPLKSNDKRYESFLQADVDSYKPKDYLEESRRLFEIMKSKASQAGTETKEEENAWRPEGKTKENDDIPF